MRYTGYRDRPQEERQIRFQNGCREGHTEIAFTCSGTNIQLVFNLNLGPYHPEREVDFEKEHGKVSHSPRALLRNSQVPNWSSGSTNTMSTNSLLVLDWKRMMRRRRRRRKRHLM